MLALNVVESALGGRWVGEEAVDHTTDWYRRSPESGGASSADRLDAYITDAVASDLGWALA
jgi:CDP-glucose 4,6-dehydratase